MVSTFINWWNRSPDSLPASLSVDHSLYEVVYTAWAGGFTVASDMARRSASYVAIAASCGYITTREADNSFGRSWYVTTEGIKFLHKYWEVRL
jgi:hypothetical protein